MSNLKAKINIEKGNVSKNKNTIINPSYQIKQKNYRHFKNKKTNVIRIEDTYDIEYNKEVLDLSIIQAPKISSHLKRRASVDILNKKINIFEKDKEKEKKKKDEVTITKNKERTKTINKKKPETLNQEKKIVKRINKEEMLQEKKIQENVKKEKMKIGKIKTELSMQNKKNKEEMIDVKKEKDKMKKEIISELESKLATKESIGELKTEIKNLSDKMTQNFSELKNLIRNGLIFFGNYIKKDFEDFEKQKNENLNVSQGQQNNGNSNILQNN